MAFGALGGKMKIKTQIACDGPGCEHVKQECNHWFTFMSKGFEFSCASIEKSTAMELMAEFINGTIKHACGEACLLKIISEHIKNHAS
jgi:hypothetical protein